MINSLVTRYCTYGHTFVLNLCVPLSLPRDDLGRSVICDCDISLA